MKRRHCKFLKVGPGGTKCACCFPAPGSKARKIEFRRARRVEKRDAFKAEATQN